MIVVDEREIVERMIVVEKREKVLEGRIELIDSKKVDGKTATKGLHDDAEKALRFVVA